MQDPCKAKQCWALLSSVKASRRADSVDGGKRRKTTLDPTRPDRALGRHDATEATRQMGGRDWREGREAKERLERLALDLATAARRCHSLGHSYPGQEASGRQAAATQARLSAERQSKRGSVAPSAIRREVHWRDWMACRTGGAACRRNVPQQPSDAGVQVVVGESAAAMCRGHSCSCRAHARYGFPQPDIFFLSSPSQTHIFPGQSIACQPTLVNLELIA